jgi:tRNA (cmo5U34)-methyltransferase
VEDRWLDPAFAERWDREVLIGNPTRAEQVDILIAVAKAHLANGGAVLELGIGSGLVADALLREVPAATLVGVDFSPAMLRLAERRLAGHGPRVTLLTADLTALAHLPLPPDFQLVVAVQALHHLPHADQRAVLAEVARRLAPGGLFLLLDRVAIPVPAFRRVYAAMWERLERLTAWKSGLDGEAFLAGLAEKGDHPATVEAHLGWLRASGLEATLLHAHLNRALIAACRPTADPRRRDDAAAGTAPA